jgi:integrase
MSDLRYMKLGRGPGSTWFFVYNIPPDLRGRPQFMSSRGKPMTKITESLGTTDVEKAREVRDRRLAYWARQFRMMRQGPSEEDIQEEAIVLYRAAVAARKSTDLEFSALQAKRLNLPDDYLERLDRAIEISAADHIAEFCGRIGIQLQPKTEPYRKIGKEFLTVLTAAGALSGMLPLPDGQLLLGWSQQPTPQIEPPVPSEPKPVTAPPPKAKGAETFAEAAAIYLNSELKDGVKAATVAEYRRKIAAFEHKDKPLRLVTRGMAADFLDGLKVSKRTRNLYAALFSAVYRSAIRRERASVNPFADQRINGVGKVHYEPFEDAEIGKLFADAEPQIAPAAHTTATALPWFVRIGAFTGMRREEIAALMADDIRRDGDVWYFNIRDGKTANATRTVPVHSALVKAGLLRYRDALPSGSRLFPGLKARASKDGKLGAALGDSFEAMRKRLGIVRRGVNFHSLRHTVGDRLRQAGVTREDIAAVLGHTTSDVTTATYGHRGPGLKRLQVIIEKLRYPR